jgi:hypothetical protein
MDTIITPRNTLLSICSYNTQMRPILDETKNKALLIGPKLNPYNLCCLQECFSNANVLIAAGNHNYVASPTEKRNCITFIGPGLVTKTNYEIIYEEFEVYNDYATFQDFLASKGVLCTRLNINDSIVDVYNTHMQAGRGNAGLAATASQTQQLIDFIRRTTNPNNGIILIGDFNMGPLRDNLTYDQYTQPYDDKITMERLTSSFEHLKKSLKLKDVADELDILGSGFDRCLYCSGVKTKITPIKFTTGIFAKSNGKWLSDACPFLIDLYIEKLQ